MAKDRLVRAGDWDARSGFMGSVLGLKLTLDYTHFTRDGRPDSEVEPLIALANHFHLRDAATGRLQTSFDDNTIDYIRVLEVMRETNYPGFVGIEYVWTEWERCNEVDNLCETIRFRDLVREHVESLEILTT
jgi:sugar phosphate isomerase/epimerase